MGIGLRVAVWWAMLLAGCSWVGGSDIDATTAATVDGLVDRTWVAIDHPLPHLPTIEFARGDSADQVVVAADDTCNVSSGPITLDGRDVVDADIISPARGCSIPGGTFISVGATFDVDRDVLTVTNPASTAVRSTRHVAWDSMREVQMRKVAGAYLVGVSLVRIGHETLEVDDCSSPWPPTGEPDEPSCAPSSNRAPWFDDLSWSSARSTDDGDLVLSDGQTFVRLDAVPAGSAPTPTLAAFLAVVGGRSWATASGPAGVQPFLRPGLYGAPDVVPAAFGNDGCTRFVVDMPVGGTGWIPGEGGWTLGEREPDHPAGPCEDARSVAFGGATFRIVDDRLEASGADGTTLLLDDAAHRPARPGPPVDHLTGTWALGLGLDPVTIATDPPALRFGSCSARWSGEDQYVDVAPAPCTPAADDPTSVRFAELLSAGASLTIGLTDDLRTLYLSRNLSIDTPETVVFRLERIGENG